jgi:hypothetical protein
LTQNSKVSNLTGLSRKTIDKGIQELESKDELRPPGGLRKPGGGRKKAKNKDPTLMNHLEDIMKGKHVRRSDESPQMDI